MAGILAKKAPRTATRIAWSKAAALVGGDARLVALLAERKGTEKLTPATRSHYRHQGIPIQEVGPEVLDALEGVIPEPTEIPSALGDLLAELRQEAAFEEGLPSHLLARYADEVKRTEALFLATVRHFNEELARHRAELKREAEQL